METRKIGSLDVSVIGLGCNNFGRSLDAAATKDVIDAALAAGINFLDTADVYGLGMSEEHVGRALGRRRSEVVLASKFGMKMDERRRGARPEYIRQAVADSLKRLNTDYLDLYQLHTPDPDVPVADTLGALDELVQEGVVREIGCSNFSAAQLQEAAAAAAPGSARFVSVQNHYSLLHREPERDGVLAESEKLDVAFIPFFPLANGLLTGKYRQGEARPEGTRLSEGARGERLLTEANLALVGRLTQFCSERGHTLLELAFSWLLSRPVVSSVIAGATSVQQVRGNAAAGGWKLTEAELAEVDEILGDEANRV
jgi:aryl-alcohol dehydrogenase-like predicted oxidoreductase